MKKLTITITEQNGNRKNITVELENELADWLTTGREQSTFIFCMVCRCQREVLMIFSTRKNIAFG